MRDKSQSGFRMIDVDEWLDFSLAHANHEHYAFLCERPGSFIVSAAVEHHFFPPQTPSNDELHINVMMWKEAAWQILSVPKERHKDVVNTAQAFAMRVCQNPPSMLTFGRAAMLITVPPNITEAEIKTKLKTLGLPKELVDVFSGLEIFPGEIRKIHAVENDNRLLKTPVKPEEIPAIQNREHALIDMMGHGVIRPIKELADYVYGSNRVIAAKL